MRRRALLWLAGVALVVGALLLTDRLLWQPGLTEGNVRRIKPGMTLAEVEALLGGPATDTVGFAKYADRLDYRWSQRWKARGAWAEVAFFAGGPSPDLSPVFTSGWAGDQAYLARVQYEEDDPLDLKYALTCFEAASTH
jgi:hypothetical protein